MATAAAATVVDGAKPRVVEAACPTVVVAGWEKDLDAMHRLRCGFDPYGRCNPGKVFPTPRLCGEVPGPYRQHPLERDGVAERW